MKKIFATVLCIAMVMTSAFIIGACKEDGGSNSSSQSSVEENSSTSSGASASDSSATVAAPTDFAVSVEGVISYQVQGDVSCALYRGETKLIDVESGDDISALVTASVATYTVRSEGGASNAVTVYKPQIAADFSVNGTYLYFTAESGVTYDLLINGVKKGTANSGDNIKAYLVDGPWEICVAVDGGVEGDTVRLQGTSNTVSINASGDNDVEYDDSWLK